MSIKEKIRDQHYDQVNKAVYTQVFMRTERLHAYNAIQYMLREFTSNYIRNFRGQLNE